MDIEKIIRDYLPQVMHMSLATCKDNKPWACEVHFAYDEDLNLYFRSTTSRRHSQEISANPNVAGNIVIQCSLDQGCKGVVDFEGTAEMLPPGDQQNRACKCIKERLKREDDILGEAQRPDGHQFYKITVKTFYYFGSLEGKPAQKYELKWNDKA